MSHSRLVTLLCARTRVADPNSDAQRTFASELKTAIPALVICLSVSCPPAHLFCSLCSRDLALLLPASPLV